MVNKTNRRQFLKNATALSTRTMLAGTAGLSSLLSCAPVGKAGIVTDPAEKPWSENWTFPPASVSIVKLNLV